MHARLIFLLGTCMVLLSSPVLSDSICVDDVSEAIAQTRAGWIADESVFGGLSRDEFKQLLGHRMSLRIEAPGNTDLSIAIPASLPASFDWRNYNGIQWMTSVKNQGTCGSCTAFASIGALEAIYRTACHNPGLDIDLSEQHLFGCVGGVCAGSAGISFEEALSYFLYNGVPDESCFPYEGIDRDCASTCPDWQSRTLTISGFQRLSPENHINPELLKPAIMIQPLLCSMLVYDDLRYYAGGVYQHVTGDYLGGHAVIIVGWDDATSCWICKNSWGSNWGEEGYFRIRWEDCGIGSESTFIFYNLPFPAPTLDVDLTMPSAQFSPGSNCACSVSVTHVQGYALGRCPLLVVLSAYGNYFYAPGFSNQLDYYVEVFAPGTTSQTVIPNFAWPSGVGSGSATFYSGILDPKLEQVISNIVEFDFSWVE